MSIVVKMKPLYIVAGGFDGYTSVQYTFDKDLATQEVELAKSAEGCMNPDFDAIMVPEAMTYADLGITYPLEGNYDE